MKSNTRARDVVREQGHVALLTRDVAAAHAMRDAVHADPLAHAVLSAPGKAEQTLAWQEDGTWARAMLDRWPDPDADVHSLDYTMIVDVKTAVDVSDEHLTKTAWAYGYHQQEDFYRRGYRAVHDVDPDFAFVFVRSSPPHLVRVVQLDDMLRAAGRDANDRALAVWRDCQESGDWPAYPPVGDITLIGPPRWARTWEDTP